MTKNMKELNLNEMINISGGDSSDPFDVYADYVNTLYAKYHCEHSGIRYLKTQCTPEEVERLIELWHAFLYADDTAA